MDDGATQRLSAAEQPVQAAVAPPDAVHGRPVDDPRALTILTTEHWSLLSARALVYNEAFARGGMFLSFLSATLVALGLVSAAAGFSPEFLFVVAVVLAVDLFVGVATLGRVSAATADDLRYIAGMNRIRHAYHEIVPGLERYFITGQHDDMAGIFEVYAAEEEVMSREGILHGFTTTPGMIGVLCAVLAGALAGTIALLAGVRPLVAAGVAVAVLVACVALTVVVMGRKIAGFAASMRPVFPRPPRIDDSAG